MSKNGFSVHCPTKGIANNVYEIMLSHGANKNIRIIETALKCYGKAACLAMYYNSKNIAYGSFGFNTSEAGRKDWDFYNYSNDLEERLIRDGRLK